MTYLKKAALSAIAIAMVATITSCQMVNLAPAGPAPGTVGFYDYNAPTNKIVTEDMKVVRLSVPGDRVFAYKVNEDMIVLGAGDVNANAKIKPLDEVSGGVAITVDSAKKLSAFLEKITTQYNTKDKKFSQYQDFRIMTNGTVVTAATVTAAPAASDKAAAPATAEKITVANPDVITLRLQYVYNMVEIENAELTLCYFGGSASGALKQLTIAEITALLASLQKI
jgi:hypothetical protein